MTSSAKPIIDPERPDPRDAATFLAIGKQLLAEGRAAEALEALERAIRPEDVPSQEPARKAAWVWRELGLCRFGDGGCVSRLERLAQETVDLRLAATARSLALACAFLLGMPLDEGRIISALEAIDFRESPGTAAVAWCAADLIRNRPDRLDDVLGGLLSEDEPEGEAEILWIFAERFGDEIACHPRGDSFRSWFQEHVDPIRQARIAFDGTVFSHLSDEPRLRSVNCARCDGRCCYDGVYVTYEEEARISAFRHRHPERFPQVPETFTEEGEWGFLFHGRRTLRVPHAFHQPDFPKHFTQTKCVFVFPNGECSLQKAATELGYHPWRFKPASCWQFPLIGLFNEDALERPHYFGVPDPGYCDESHPGYVSFMPCAVLDSGGVSWKTAYRNELQFFLHLKATKRQ